jgi:tetratricopeptide (TPR) repeat protein
MRSAQGISPPKTRLRSALVWGFVAATMLMTVLVLFRFLRPKSQSPTANTEPARHTEPARQMPDDACDKNPNCKAHYDKAVNYYSEQSYHDAVLEFQMAYQEVALPMLLINIGRSLHKDGRPKEAVQYYERYLSAEPKGNPTARAHVEEYKIQAQVMMGP